MDKWTIITEIREHRDYLAARGWHGPGAMHYGSACLVAKLHTGTGYISTEAHWEVVNTLVWAGAAGEAPLSSVYYLSPDGLCPAAFHWNDYVCRSKEEALSVLDATIERLVMEMEPAADVTTIVVTPDAVTVS